MPGVELMSPRALRQQIGQLLMAGFNGTALPTELRALAREFSLGGVVFFKRNVEEPEQVAEVARDIRALA
jgi:beta-N-acetylhexosaminidase